MSKKKELNNIQIKDKDSTDDVFLVDISNILTEGRKKAYYTVNVAMVETYWFIGKRIVEEEQKGIERAKYGEQLLKKLSIYLGNSFGKGFSYANLNNFRQFYLTWPNEEILYTLCRELSWTHIRLIMRVDDVKARIYYIEETKEQKWSTRVLERNIHSGYYFRLLSNQKSKLAGTQKHKPQQIDDFIKDPYIIEFLGLPEDSKSKESVIEASIINNLQSFLMEMGKGFSFVGRQFRISTETTHYFIDLVFYNYILKCFVIIDLKTTKLSHQDVGQIDMYVRMFDDLKRNEDDNPTIGLILCAEKDEVMAKYSYLAESQQIFASKYIFILPSEEELIKELEKNARFLRTLSEDSSD